MVTGPIVDGNGVRGARMERGERQLVALTTQVDEVIVLTAPHLVEEFGHRDWESRACRRHNVVVPAPKLAYFGEE
ncbi:hypothetical protein GZL_09150 [Streptomyces sp. 769]|nr:hypothetical protein GZL_09150 [Streptomyces sp. 769]